jgi:malate synthase
MTLALPTGVSVLGPLKPGYEAILTEGALAFVAALERRFGPRIEERLAARVERQARLAAGETYRFLPETQSVRDGAWTCAPVPADIQDRRVEITGPVDRKMIINALNSGANVFMADFEDATAPTFANQVEGQMNLLDANSGTISLEQNGKKYALNEKPAILFVRPRGLHLPERHVTVDGKTVHGNLFDFGLYFYHNAKFRAERKTLGEGVYLYLPKLESHLEARIWNDIFLFAEETLGLPVGTVKATVLIETLPAAFEMNEILHELKEHSAGLNCGRWDYIFSFIKKHASDKNAILPDRGTITMDRGFLRAYSQLLIQTCHKREVHAMGGMAAFIPVKGNEAENDAAFAKVKADKEREANDGHDGTWVAHPGLVATAKAVFDAKMPGKNQLSNKRLDVAVTAADLLAIPDGPRTEPALRHNIKVGIQYIEAWLRGNGCVPLYNLMEDAATAEISRAQVWQWLTYGVALDDGEKLTGQRFLTMVGDAMEEVRRELGDDRFAAGRFPEARDLFEKLSTASTFEEFLTVPAYAKIVTL